MGIILGWQISQFISKWSEGHVLWMSSVVFSFIISKRYAHNFRVPQPVTERPHSASHVSRNVYSPSQADAEVSSLGRGVKRR